MSQSPNALEPGSKSRSYNAVLLRLLRLEPYRQPARIRADRTPVVRTAVRFSPP